MHPLLIRQLARLGIGDVERLPDAEQWRQLLLRVSQAYQETDQDRYLLERSQDLASAEMSELYRALEAEAAALESRVEERTRSLRESEGRLLEAQRIATLGSWSHAPQTDRVEWSEECYRLFGFDPQRGPPPIDEVLDRVHPDDRDRVRGYLRGAYRQGMNNDTEFRIVRDDGRTLWLHALEETLTGSGGEVLLLRGTVRDITRQKEAEFERDHARQRLNTALHGSNLILVDVDPAGVVFLSERWSVLLGGELKETYISFDALMALTHEDEREAILHEYVDALTGRKPEYNIEHRVRANDGSWRWIRSRGRVTERDAHGRAVRLAGINEDITSRKLTEEKLGRSEARFRSLLALSSDWYWEQDEELRFTEVAGTDPERDRLGLTQFLGRHGFDDDWLDAGEADRARYRALTAAREPFRDLCHSVRGADGEVRYISYSGEPVFDGDRRFTGYRGIARDVTQAHRAEERIRRLAHFDELTGLPNRTMFMFTLQRALSLAQRRGKSFAIFFIDLDRFKNINDSLGHEAGDRLLQDVARRLRLHLRESDTVARLGGDEFVVLVEDCADALELNAIAQHILSSVGRPYLLSGREYHVTGSIGISTYPADGLDPAALLKNADIAMYLAKDRGKNTFQFYSAQQNAHSFERLALESALRHALGREEFVLHYQPKLAIGSGHIVGVEALLRWNHPDLAMVAPNQFIPLAEETGLIVPIGRWVLRNACLQAAAWQRDGMPGMRVAVNLSARQFVDDALIDDVSDALVGASMTGDGLELEITESMVMQNPERAVTTLNRLRALGITVSIDDFGTGYSSLGYLKRFPIDNVKVDRSFIKDLPDDADDAAITLAIIAMARSLRIRVIAEGVETREQLQFLRDHGCDECQGYYLSPPLPAAEVELFARAWRPEQHPRRFPIVLPATGKVA
ncbi:MAG: EAL domain-containing protein [Burkholderiales bacterium]|nr:EAL domain-containing protein [Burkholderiales bacterium]